MNVAAKIKAAIRKKLIIGFAKRDIRSCNRDSTMSEKPIIINTEAIFQTVELVSEDSSMFSVLYK